MNAFLHPESGVLYASLFFFLLNFLLLAGLVRRRGCRIDKGVIQLCILVALTIGLPLTAEASFPPTPGGGAPCSTANYGSSPYASDPDVTSTKYCVPLTAGSINFSYGWSHTSGVYGWPGVTFPCGDNSCKTGAADWPVGTLWGVPDSCPAGSDFSGGQCTCKADYQQNTGNNGCDLRPSPPSVPIPPELELVELGKARCLSCQDGFKAGHPIIPATGEKVLDQTDYTGAGADALLLQRHYRSSWAGSAGRGLVVDAGLGRAWTHNHAVSIQREGTPGATGSSAKVMFGDGRVRAFDWQTGSSSWLAANSADTLTANSTGLLYKRLDDDSLWQFDSAGRLLTVTRRNGWVNTYAYSTGSTSTAIAPVPGLLITVSNQFGRSLNFAYNAAKQLVKVTANGARVVDYAYDGTIASSRLTTVTFPGNVSGTVSKTYLYENATYPQLVTGIVDEMAQRYQTISYDSLGRGSSTQLAGGADLYTVSYGTGAATVTDPLGIQRTYNYSITKGKLAVTGADKPSGTGNSSAASRVQDANGFVTQETDFLGINTIYTWDASRRLPLTVTQAASLPEAKTTTTQWHSTFRLPVLVTEAGRTTAYTYDAGGNPLTETVTDTASGTARTTTWTYNAQGLPATEKAPNGVVTNTYAYYTGTSTNFAAPAPASLDPAFESVSLLLRGDGADGSTAFIDSSLVPKALTAGGNARMRTAQSKFGGSSLYFDGVRDYVSLPADQSLSMNSFDFTIEMWVHKLGDNANYARLWSADGDMYSDVNLSIDPTGKLVSFGSSDGTSWNAWAFGTGVAIPDGVWTHVALVRLGGAVTLYVDGVGTVLTTALGTATLYGGGYAHAIGAQSVGVDRAFNGYIDEVRITKGLARYAANFTPPAQAFPGALPPLDPNEVGHTINDLQTVTNAAGHVTQFTQYDRSGRVRQMVDPKGVVTDVIYTPRGLTSSVTVTPPDDAATTTSYTYDNAGQLTGATLPDGTTLGYSYDAAHRLTGVTDAKGNTVTYTLDNAGNKTGEQVKDFSGTLQRNITRVYDALNRIQQVTGASN